MALFVSPFAQYTDASGNPGSGYRLYFYQTGTTTPITIYSDSAFATPTANPAIADSAGQWDAIYVNTGSYKVVMKSAADVTIRTADPVSGAPVSGPTSATDNAAARFDGTTGKILQNSLVIIDDSGNVTGVVNFTATGSVVGVAGTFSGAVSGTTGTFTGAVSGTTGTFTGVVSASNGTAAAPGFKLASSQVGLYRTTSDGGIGFTTAGVSKGAFHSTGFSVVLGSSPDQLIDPDGTVVGASMSTVGQIGNYVSNNTCMFLGRSNSGSLVDFHTAGATKGTISEAAGTVTYGAFCGAHWGQFDDGERHDILPGTILETIDEMCLWLALSYVDHEGVKRLNEQSVPIGAKAGDVVDYSYEREHIVQVGVEEDVFEETSVDHYEVKNGRAVLSSRKVSMPAFDSLPIVDASGKPVISSVHEIDAKGKVTVRNEPKYLQVRRRQTVTRDKVEKITETVKATVIEQENQTLPKIRVSADAGSARVYGVFSHWDDDDKLNNDLHSASLGAKFVRIAKGVTVQSGDYLESNGDGSARVQADDILRSSTIAKVTAAIVVETYADGSYLVPCTLHCG